MILPYAHDDHQGRRWPLVTIGLIVVNIVCFVASTIVMQDAVRRADAIAQAMITMRESSPPDVAASLQCPTLDRLQPVASRAPTERAIAAHDAAAEAYFAQECRQLTAAIDEIPSRRFGFIPAHPEWLTVVTYPFLHGGWLHLLGNLWFLWLCGCNVEDRWGRAVYLPFYLAAGVSAAIAEKILAPHSIVPMIGASGAIAGAMGAFLVSFARTRIRFAYFLFFRWGTFVAPAAVMLPLWLVNEVVWGMVGRDSVAHWAHVGGFAFGVAFAFALRRTGWDAKLDDGVERTVSKSQDPRILRAGELTTAGSPNEALAILGPLDRLQPRSIDVQLEILRAAKAAKIASVEHGAYKKLVELYFDARTPETAAQIFDEMCALRIDGELPRGSVLRIADHYVSVGLYGRADTAYASACRDGIVDVVATRATLAHARVLARLGRIRDARELLAAVRASPFLTSELASIVDEELRAIPS